MVMPNGRSITFPRAGYCIRKDAFERWLFEDFAALGGEAHLGERVLGAAEENGRVRLRTRRGEYAAVAVVAADGPLSRVAVALGLVRDVRCISAIQYKFHAGDDRGAGILNFYFSGRMAGGYFWLFPRGDEISVGVGGTDRALLRDALDDFCGMHGYEPSARISAHGGLIPDGGLASRVSSERVVVCGDAAGLVHPASKGGIHLAVYSGRAAGRAVAGLIGSGMSLSSYSRQIGEIAAFHRPYYERLKSVLRFTDREYNLVGDLAGGGVRGLWRVLPRPSSWRIVPRLLGLYRAYVATERWLW